MKKVRFETANSVGHFELPDDAVILNNEDDVLEDDGMYPADLKMEGDDNGEKDREVKDDNVNSSPLDREEGMFPAGVK